MRLLAAADIHGFENVLQWIVGQARSFQVDALVLAGDLLGVPDGFESVEQAMLASAKCTTQILRSAACPVLYIMGNDDLVDTRQSTKSTTCGVGEARREPAHPPQGRCAGRATGRGSVCFCSI